MYINAGNNINQTHTLVFKCLYQIPFHPVTSRLACMALRCVGVPVRQPPWLGSAPSYQRSTPGNLFYRCPITAQTQGVVSGKPIII